LDRTEQITSFISPRASYCGSTSLSYEADHAFKIGQCPPITDAVVLGTDDEVIGGLGKFVAQRCRGRQSGPNPASPCRFRQSRWQCRRRRPPDRGYVRPTVEVILIQPPSYLRKRKDPETGLALIDIA
jgi:hypothetical protein